MYTTATSLTNIPNGKNANLTRLLNLWQVKERREKFLTAKYGSHQMALIRKRLAVEMWLYDELQKLYETPVRHPILTHHHSIFARLHL